MPKNISHLREKLKNAINYSLIIGDHLLNKKIFQATKLLGLESTPRSNLELAPSGETTRSQHLGLI